MFGEVCRRAGLRDQCLGRFVKGRALEISVWEVCERAGLRDQCLGTFVEGRALEISVWGGL